MLKVSLGQGSYSTTCVGICKINVLNTRVSFEEQEYAGFKIFMSGIFQIEGGNQTTYKLCDKFNDSLSSKVAIHFYPFKTNCLNVFKK